MDATANVHRGFLKPLQSTLSRRRCYRARTTGFAPEQAFEKVQGWGEVQMIDRLLSSLDESRGSGLGVSERSAKCYGARRGQEMRTLIGWRSMSGSEWDAGVRESWLGDH
jgi:hypothetical protein